MNVASAKPVTWGKAGETSTTRWLVPGALLLVLAMQLPLLFNRAINWDEFWHYSLTVLAAHGELDQPLQTFFTRLFMWVPALPGSSVDHIVLIRLFMLGCEIVTLACIVAIATRFADRTTGLLCALAYLSAAYVFQHGTSFRFDPQATALLMASLWVILCRPTTFKWLALAGALLGLAGLITIKSVLYAPAVAGAIWLRWDEIKRARSYIAGLAVMSLVAAATFVFAYALHAAGIVDASGSGAKDIVNASTSKMFSLTYHPYILHNLKGAVLSPAMTLLALATPFAITLVQRPSAQRIALAGFWSPLTTLGFYHNTAPYYHVFMLAPVSVSLAAVVPVATRRYGVGVLTAIFVMLAGLLLWRESESPIDKQRQLVTAADEIFRAPVSYFDSCAMLGKFDKANAFLTPWGVERYLRGELPSMTTTLERKVVPLVVDNDPLLAQALRTRDTTPGLLALDVATLRETYVPFWGPFWIAGFDLKAGTPERAFIVRVPGEYTVRGAGAIVVDGVRYGPDSVLALGRGTHRLAAPEAAAMLLWGRKLVPPARMAPAEPYFTDF